MIIQADRENEKSVQVERPQEHVIILHTPPQAAQFKLQTGTKGNGVQVNKNNLPEKLRVMFNAFAYYNIRSGSDDKTTHKYPYHYYYD